MEDISGNYSSHDRTVLSYVQHDQSTGAIKNFLDTSINPVNPELSNLMPAQQYEVEVYTLVRGHAKHGFEEEKIGKQFFYDSKTSLNRTLYKLDYPVQICFQFPNNHIYIKINHNKSDTSLKPDSNVE